MRDRRSRSMMPLLPLALILLTGRCSAPPSSTSAVPDDEAARAGASAAGTMSAVSPTSSAQPSSAAPEAVPLDPAAVQPDNKPSPGTKWGDATIPAGRKIEAVLQEKIDSGTARTGTIIRAVTDAPVRVDEVEVLPAGSTFDGLLGQVIPADEGRKAGGTIALRFRLVRTPVGSAAPLEAVVSAAVAAPGGSPNPSIAGPEPVVGGSFGGTVLAAGEQGVELILAGGTRLTLVMSEDVPIKVRL